ncbi:MAG: CysS/YqeB C-terminal domain-containing protein, partial [Candidatus Aminicenantales bacterium]
AGSGKIQGTSQFRGTPGVMPGESSDPEKRLEAEVQAKIEARQEARAAKDFATADAIRQELLAMGIVLEDTRDGVRWKKLGPPKG